MFDLKEWPAFIAIPLTSKAAFELIESALNEAKEKNVGIYFKF